MTMLDSITVRCALCGTETLFHDIFGTHSFGSSDLDTRSPAMRGVVLEAAVQRCSGCGYCTSDISVATPDALAVIYGQEYRNQLNDPACPELANSFLCKAILDRESKNYSNATWALIKASWVCDDTGHVVYAKVCRHRAIAMLMVANMHNQQLAEQAEMTTVILVDLLRRTEQEDQARKVIASRQGRISDDLIKRILDYQIELIDRNDFSRHRIAESLSQLKQNSPEVVAKGGRKVVPSAPSNADHDSSGDSSTEESNANEWQVEVEKLSERFDSDVNEDIDAEAIWEEYQREQGNESSSIDCTDLEAIWEEYQSAILEERRREDEEADAIFMDSDPTVNWEEYRRKKWARTYSQKVFDSVKNDGIEATAAWMAEESKARKKARRAKAIWDWIGKIGVAVFFIAIILGNVLSRCS